MATQDLCVLADVRAELKLGGSDTSLDTLIAAHITNASDTIMREFEREFKTTLTSPPNTRRFRWLNGNLIDLAPYDLQTATTVTLHPESSSPVVLTANTDYQFTPITTVDGVYTTARLSGLLVIMWSQTLIRFGYAILDIAGTWGFPAVPNQVKQAAIETVSSWVRRDIGAYAGQDLSGVFTPQEFSSYSIPLTARLKLNPFRRTSGAV